MNPRNNAGLTWVEVVVALGILGVLAFLAMPSVTICVVKGPETQTLSNFRQLHLATQTMALDGEATNDPARGWPGDTGGTFSNWARQLVPVYLSTNDFCKLSSAPGVTVRNGAIPAMEQVAFRVYAVDSSLDGSVVFLTSANFTNTPRGGMPLSRKAKPYGDRDFVVFRKGGDGAILLKNQATNMNLIGTYAPMCQ